MVVLGKNWVISLITVHHSLNFLRGMMPSTKRRIKKYRRKIWGSKIWKQHNKDALPDSYWIVVTVIYPLTYL